MVQGLALLLQHGGAPGLHAPDGLVYSEFGVRAEKPWLFLGMESQWNVSPDTSKA